MPSERNLSERGCSEKQQYWVSAPSRWKTKGHSTVNVADTVPNHPKHHQPTHHHKTWISSEEDRVRRIKENIPYPTVDDDGFIPVRKTKRRLTTTHHPNGSGNFWNVEEDAEGRRSDAFGRRKQVLHLAGNNGVLHQKQPAPASRDGNRGHSRHLWWRGPREPPRPGLDSQKGVVTLFIDGISNTTTLTDIRALFEKYGVVNDVYISGKHRKNKNEGFGFVRYTDSLEASTAIKQLDGYCINGGNLRVSMAKYQKGGSPVAAERQRKSYENRKIISPAHRDHRRYAEVLLGSKQRVQPSTQLGQNKMKIIVQENPTISKKLNLAVVVVFKEFMDPNMAASLIKDTKVPISCMSSISPTKLLLFFDNEHEMKHAMKETSPLRVLFKDVRRWSDDECLRDRLVWLEWRGIHPKCWSIENLKKISAKWGLLLYIDHNFMGFNSITNARLLIQTKEQNRIDECINLVWESGSCELWIKEVDCCEDQKVCEIISRRNKEYVESEPDVEEDRPFLNRELVLEQEIFRDEDAAGNNVLIADHLQTPVELELRRECEQRLHNSSPNGSHNVCLDESQQQNEDWKNSNSELEMEPVNENQIDHIMDPLVIRPAAEPLLGENFDPMCLEKFFSYAEDCHNCPQPERQFNPRYMVSFENSRCSPDLLPNLTSVELPPIRIDPMYQMECVPLAPTSPAAGNRGNMNMETITGFVSTSKRPRGRPKKNAMIPPVSVLPSLNPSEVSKTWEIAKLIGISCNDEESVLKELRKSKRLATMVETPQ
ncbi:unnamed protein product [Amaranthus hypochondriacus]